MKADEILEMASDLVTGDRASEHGDMKENMERIARLWNVYLAGGRLISSTDVAVMLALMKIARIATGKHRPDNFIDIAGYAAIAGQVSE